MSKFLLGRESVHTNNSEVFEGLNVINEKRDVATTD